MASSVALLLLACLAVCVFSRSQTPPWSSSSGMFAKLSKTSPRTVGASVLAAAAAAAASATAPSSCGGATGSLLPRTVPPILLALFGFVFPSGASPLNPQTVTRVGSPFFQGWLVRTVDHAQDLSVIFIVGSFSSAASGEFSEHYVFCAAAQRGRLLCHAESFPDPETVTVTGSRPSVPSLLPQPLSPPPAPVNVTWSAQGLGRFRFTAEACEVDFRLPGAGPGRPAVGLRLRTAGRGAAWGPGLSGPEGWLGRLPLLLPCHYFVHSVGVRCDYRLRLALGPASASASASASAQAT